jgi:hypothetical protein
MTYKEFREFRSFVMNLTAKADTPWCATQEVPLVNEAAVIVRVDPVESARRGEAIRSDEVFRIPAGTSLEDAKALVIDRLAKASGPPS